nr:hypothetical protein [uncultured Acetobacter sp.]
MKIEVILRNPDFNPERPLTPDNQQYNVFVNDIGQGQLLECNLSPVWVLDVTSSHIFPDSRKMLNNISDRGYIPFERENDSPKASRLYNFYGALRFAIMRSGSAHGIAYEISSEIADTWVEYFSENFECFDSLDEFSDFFVPKALLMTKDLVGKRYYEIKDTKEFDLEGIFESGNCSQYCSFNKPMFRIPEILSNYAKHLFAPEKPPRKVVPMVEKMMRGSQNAG